MVDAHTMIIRFQLPETSKKVLNGYVLCPKEKPTPKPYYNSRKTTNI